jgi:hypothetical protein
MAWPGVSFAEQSSGKKKNFIIQKFIYARERRRSESERSMRGSFCFS